MARFFYRNAPTVEAEQIGSLDPWPELVQPWPDDEGRYPRDGSCGYIDLEGPNGSTLRVHVRKEDWIVTFEQACYFHRDQNFRQLFVPEAQSFTGAEGCHGIQAERAACAAIAEEEADCRFPASQAEEYCHGWWDAAGSIANSIRERGEE